MLLIAIAAAILVSCSILTWMAWQAPGVVAYLQRPTLTPTSAPASATPKPTDTPPPVPSATRAPTETATLAPTATQPPNPSPTLTAPPTPIPNIPEALPTKTILIDLSDQTLTAFENATPVFSTLISAGQRYTPTPIGDFAIYSKIRSQTMSGPGYRLPNVQWVAYFYKSYAIHGTYWHDNFGHPMSHGCVNMRNIDAQWLYEWAPIGTPVSVRH